MAEPFLSRLRAVIDELDLADQDCEIVCRHFFSGAAAWADGRIFISLTPAGLALKLPDEDCRTLLDAGGAPLRYFRGAPVKTGYVVLPEVHRTGDALRQWVVKSLEPLTD